MLFGDMHEVLNAGKAAKDVDWTMFWYGSILGMVAWGVMYYELWRIPSTEDLPWWVWLALGMYQFFFMTFPITMWQQYKQKGKFDNAKYPLLDNGGYLQGELQYMFLSLVSKSILAWSVAGAVMGPESDVYSTIDDNLS